ncbi:unnamed protein product [Camellia sinensis]
MCFGACSTYMDLKMEMERELVELVELAKKVSDSTVAERASSRGPKVDRCIDQEASVNQLSAC